MFTGPKTGEILLNWLRIRLLEIKANADAERPIRFLREKQNVWRVVYADGQN